MIDINKYEDIVIKNLDDENLKKIAIFLLLNNCDYVKELLEDYLDLFSFEYDDFVLKFQKLNKKYNNNLINEIRNDMNILEEFYQD